jgi:hypothetical protein
MTQLTKALMDGGNVLNLMCLDTFEALGLTRDQLQSSPHPFGDLSNYHRETLMFEVVNFSGAYHVILGWLCYVKFIAIPSYTYLKLKIPGPVGVITVEAKTQRALDCE